MLGKEAFQKQMLEKLIWICAFMLVGARNQGITVGAVEKDHRSEASRFHGTHFISIIKIVSSDSNL